MPEHPSNGPLDRIRFFSLRCPSTLEARIMPPRLPNKLHAVALTSSSSSSAPRSPANHTIPTSVTQENGSRLQTFPKDLLKTYTLCLKISQKISGSAKTSCSPSLYVSTTTSPSVGSSEVSATQMPEMIAQSSGVSQTFQFHYSHALTLQFHYSHEHSPLGFPLPRNERFVTERAKYSLSTFPLLAYPLAKT